MCQKVLDIPQSKKGMSLTEALAFVDSIMGIFHQLEDMTDLKSMYEAGKQLSRLYFDSPNFRTEIADALNTQHDFAAYASKMMKKLNNMGVFKNDEIWFSSFYFYNITWNFSDCSPMFASNLGYAGLPNLLNLNIGHQPYVDNLSSKNVYYLMKASLSLMHNIARVPGNACYFGEESVKKALVYLAQREEEFLKCVATLTLAYIIAENEPIMRESSAEIVNKILTYIRLAMKAEKKRYHGFTIEELVAALAAMAVNESVKKLVVAQDGIQLMKELCTSDNPLEIEFACRTLWNLSFDSEIRTKLLADTQLVPALIRLKAHSTPTVAKMAEGALWVIAEESKRIEAIIKTPSLGHPATGDKALKNYVFISYCWFNKDAVLRLRERLSEAGIPVWIDVEQHQELTQPALARGIEQAKVVMLCMSEPYRTSPNCRTEAEYAYALRKPILPVVMQHKYRPESWLRVLLNNAPYYDVASRRSLDSGWDQMLPKLREMLITIRDGTSYCRENSGGYSSTLDETGHTPVSTVNDNHKPNSPTTPPVKIKLMKRVKEDAEDVTVSVQAQRTWASDERDERSIQNTNASQTTLLVPFRLNSKVLGWSNSDVLVWLEKNDLQKVKPAMSNINGRLLAQLFQIRREAPDFFFRCLDAKLGFQFVDILKFSEAILNLSST